MDNAVIETAQLAKTYGTFDAVSNLNLSVGKGEVFAFLGPNGAGKTTTIRMLMGILAPTSGTARVAGLDCFAAREEVMRHVGYLPDDPVFYDFLRGSEIIGFVGEMHGLNEQEIAERSEPLVTEFDLGDALDEYATNYSRGMKKKLAFVCALLHEPTVLILDEPTSGLDPIASRAIQDMVRSRAEQGTTVFFSTHLLDQAQKICHRAGILHHGKLRAVGTPDELRRHLAPGGSLEEVFFAVTAADSADAATPSAVTQPMET